MGMEPRWKIAELAAVVGRVLVSGGQAEQPSSRVRDVPDLRTIRYYTTLGLVDRPLEMQGRTAYYGWRHAWQLLAIKQLQASGHSLVEVQERLAGADDRTLKKIARLPDRLLRMQAAGLADADPPRSTATRTTFWADPPARGADESRATIGGEAPRVLPAMHLHLDHGVTLVLEGVEPGALNRDKLAAIELAARGLVTQLRQFGVAGLPLSAVPDTTRQESRPDTKGAERSRS
jgi:DNA-binding transcriptional MerR regulator